MARKASSKPSAPSTASIGFEAILWLAADKLRNNMDAAEYKHVVLGLSHGGKRGDISIYGQDKRARWQRLFGLAKRARRVRLRGQQPKQNNASTLRLAIRGIKAEIGKEHADQRPAPRHPHSFCHLHYPAR